MQSNSHFEKNTNKKQSKHETEELDAKEKKRKHRVKTKRDLYDEVMDLYDPKDNPIQR